LPLHITGAMGEGKARRRIRRKVKPYLCRIAGVKVLSRDGFEPEVPPLTAEFFVVLVTILLLFSRIIRPVLAAVDFVNHRRTSSQQS
jgi:hypothetical protein